MPFDKQALVWRLWRLLPMFTFTSDKLDISEDSPSFSITNDYFNNVFNNTPDYFTIESVSTTLTYTVTTSSNFTETLTASYNGFSISDSSFNINLSGDGSGTINKICSFYPYLNLFDTSCLTGSHVLYFNSIHMQNIEAGNFTLNPNSISSPNDNNTYSILIPFYITWDKVNIDTNYNVNTDPCRITLNDIIITPSTYTPYLWEIYKTNYTGTFDILIHSVKYLIYNTFTITINKASQADYGLLQNKKLGVAPCSSLTLIPALSRATTNNICVTNKKNNVPTTTIQLGNRRFLIPCGIVKYLPELKSLITKMPLRDALLFLIQKYDIEVQRRHIINKKRYVYPTADAKIIYPILQFNTSFRLSEYNTGAFIVKNPIFVEKTQDARILEVCNDDTKTFSTLYTDMLKNATYWLTTLPSFQESSYTFCIIRPTNGSLKKVISGSIALFGNILVFTPIILRSLLFFYEPYPPNTDITIVYSNPDVSKVVEHIQQKYFQDSVVINSSCL
jgi:hypothetical protein